MTKNSCIVANTILGISLACINIVPFIMPFTVGAITYVFIACFDILAIYLSFAIDFSYAKQNRFNMKDVIMYIVFPLVTPTVIAALIFALI